MATPVVLTTGARPITPVESGGVPMTPVDTLGEPVTVVDALGEPVVLVNNDGTPAFLAYSAKTYLGGVAPYHWLDFIANRALYANVDVGNVTGATGYSFTRASQGYYTNSDGTLTLFGYNLLQQSQTFDNAGWTKTRATVTANAVAAPDGATTAETLTDDTSNNTHYAQQVLSPGANTYTYSVFAKAGTLSAIWLFAGTSAVGQLFNLSTGLVGSVVVGAPTSASIQALANGWYRCSITFTGSPTDFWVGISNSSTAFSYTGTGSGTVYIWGAQLEPSASVGTYVATTTSAAGALRRGDRGVLIEGSRTNLLVQSQEFQTTWSAVGLQAFGSGSTANAGVSPDGTTTADLLTESSANSRHFVFQLQSVSASTTYAFSIYLKYSTRRYCVVAMKSYTGSADVVAYSQVVDVQNRTLGAATNTVGSPTNTSATIELLANGWCRLNVTMNSGAGGVLMYSSVCLSDSATPSYVAEAPSYTGDGTSGVLAWQADLQAGAFPSSPIPTTSAAVTRAADVLTYTAGVSYPLSLWAEFVPNAAIVTQSALFASDGTSNNEAAIRLNTGGNPTYFSVSGGVLQSNINVGTAIANTTYKLAARFATDSVRGALDGVLGAADTSATNPATPTVLNVGSARTGTEQLFGLIRRAAVFNSALTDAQLQTTTSG